ncbi:hypothetical protein GCM10009785_15020 [Brooklawnia cerclae]|uniref:Uncharacterized protein n=1 Tax=Brooklawnia cerclae TaxID=349934 RepID=A0ABX0SHQ3_9ACTN|nr:hypothetical protein [Brooklawnia cerclae]NIH57927.1 hypothetical protein [Brooklawnia cerclae]
MTERILFTAAVGIPLVLPRTTVPDPQSTPRRTGSARGPFRAFVRWLRHPRPVPLTQLPPEVLRDADPALHDSVIPLRRDWYGGDARYHSPYH